MRGTRCWNVEDIAEKMNDRGEPDPADFYFYDVIGAAVEKVIKSVLS